MNKPTKIIVHHTGGTQSDSKASTQHHTAQVIDAQHAINWPGFTSKVFKNDKGKLYHVGYHFVIEATGKVVQTRALGEEGAHTIGMNNSSVGVCFTGNFDVERPNKSQLNAFIKLFKKIQSQYPNLTAKDIVPHRHYSTKSCFGNLLPDDYFKGLVVYNQTAKEIKYDQEEIAQRKAMFRMIELLRKQIALLTQLVTQKNNKL